MEFMPEHAPLVVMAFLGTVVFLASMALVILVAFLTKRKWIGLSAAILALVLASGYVLVLAGVSLTSHEKTLAPGENKYFCEIDCHIAYSVVNFEEAKALGDESHQTLPAGTVPLSQPLRPGESYVTDLVFDVSLNAHNLRLFVGDDFDMPNRLLIGHEDSFLHRKIFLALTAPGTVLAGRVP